MRTSLAIEHFGTQAAVAKAAGVTPQAVAQWGATVPYASALKLTTAADGVIAINPALYDDRLRPLHDDEAA